MYFFIYVEVLGKCLLMVRLLLSNQYNLDLDILANILLSAFKHKE